MNANKNASARTLGSDLAKVDVHQVDASEYDELPELTDGTLERARVNRGGRPRDGQSRMDSALKEYAAQHLRR